ncbi:MAG: molybdenum cofactor cytidylyltransferase [Desulfobacterales bacterium]|nr:molybdenum cofactor cytidylyltransferase [Desulfobacterales bacterium]
MKVLSKKVAGVILAAGSSSRMGSIKQILPFRGKTILDHVIANVQKSALHEVIVVLGYCSEKIKQQLDLADDSSNIKILINKNYLKGQSDSLKKGLEQVSNSCDGAMFLLGDQPLITDTVINKLIYAFEDSDLPLVIPYCKGKRGNPVIIARSLFSRLELLSKDSGARVLFKELEKQILKVPIDDKSILEDIDTKNDYEKLISKD